MAFNITVNFSNDGLQSESRDAFATQFGYLPTIDGQPNPQTKAQFRDEQIKKWIKGIIKDERTRAAYATAAASVVVVPD